MFRAVGEPARPVFFGAAKIQIFPYKTQTTEIKKIFCFGCAMYCFFFYFCRRNKKHKTMEKRIVKKEDLNFNYAIMLHCENAKDFPVATFLTEEDAKDVLEIIYKDYQSYYISQIETK